VDESGYRKGRKGVEGNAATKSWCKQLSFYDIDGYTARYSGVYHAGLHQSDGSVIGGRAEATQRYHDVGLVVVPRIGNRAMLAARQVDATG
jgi:hypothetical protein